MRRGPLWKISLTTTPEAEDAVAEALANLFATTANGHTDVQTGRITVSVFSETKPAPLARLQRAWRDTIGRLNSFGLNTGPARLRVERIRRENWAESWKRHFKPLEVGGALLLKPSWIKRQPKPGQTVVVIDPGLSFGTGQHPTTSFCLRELVRLRKYQHLDGGLPGRRKPAEKSRPLRKLARSFLDIGTGSGILAIAAVKLGYTPVHAFDFDPESVRVARANARANHVERKLRITRNDLTRLPARTTKRYDVVCANLISTLLIAERHRICQRLRLGGSLVVAGILAAEFAAVVGSFAALGLRLIAWKREQEWTSGTFAAPRMDCA